MHPSVIFGKRTARYENFSKVTQIGEGYLVFCFYYYRVIFWDLSHDRFMITWRALGLRIRCIFQSFLSLLGLFLESFLAFLIVGYLAIEFFSLLIVFRGPF